MPDDDIADPRKSGSPTASRNTEPTQRFSALQHQLLCAAIHFFHRHIRSDPEVLQRMEGNQMFRRFFEMQYHDKPGINQIFPDSVHDCSALHVCSFILSILHQGIFSVSAFIVGVIYLSRFKESSHITLHAVTWRPLFLTSLLLADKMWEDKPVRNSSLAKLFPVLNNSELNKMESEFLTQIQFNVIVKPDLFCSFCEKLLAEMVDQDIVRCVSASEYAETLQADMVDNCAPTGKPAAMGKELMVQQQMHHEQQQQQQQQQQQHKHQSSVEKMHSQQAMPTTARPGLPLSTRATVGGHPVGNHNHIQRPPQAWLEQGMNTGSSGTAQPGRNGAGASGATTALSAPGSSGSEGLAPRSQSAGPTTSASSRRAHSQAPTPQVHGPHLGGTHQQQANNDSHRPSLRTGTNAMAAAVAAAREAALGTGSSQHHGQTASATRAQSGQQQAKRSISVHPLNRNDSIKKHPSSKADDMNEARSARPAGHPPPPQPATSGLSGLGAAPLRRSLPAKTSISAFMPLARTLSSAGGASSSVSAAPGGTLRGTGTSVAPPGSHSGSAARESAGSLGSPRKGGPLLSAGRGRESPRRTGITSGHGSSAGRPQGQSPRSPTGMSPLHGDLQHQLRNTAGQPSRATLPSHLRSRGEAPGWGEGRVTPPAPVNAAYGGSLSSAKVQEARGISPADGGASLHHGAQGAGGRSGSSLGLGQPVAPRGSSQPTRASSTGTPAPRMNSMVQRQTGPAASHAGHGQSSPSTSSPVPSNSPTRQQAHLGHCSPPVPTSGSRLMFPNSPAVRGASVNSQVLMNAPRGATGGGGSGHTAAASAMRNPSPVGLTGPNSPQHMLGGHQQVPLAGIGAQGHDRLGQQRGVDALGETGRGRSPPQGMAGANSSGSGTTLRQPRAITPSSLVKGITQGIHAGGMVTRGSLGPSAAALHRPVF